MGILEEWPMRFVQVRRYLWDVQRRLLGRQWDVWAWSSEHRIDCEMWDSTTMFWKLNPWKGGSSGGAHGQWDFQVCACFMKPHSPKEDDGGSQALPQRVFVFHIFSYPLLWRASYMFVAMTLSLLAQRGKRPWVLRSSASICCFLGWVKCRWSSWGAWTRRVQVWVELRSPHHPRCWVPWPLPTKSRTRATQEGQSQPLRS